MPIGIWGGYGKPTDLNEYLKSFVAEIDAVTKHGVIINGYRLDVQIRSFLCDAPARSFLKGCYFLLHFVSKHNFVSFSISLFDEN